MLPVWIKQLTDADPTVRYEAAQNLGTSDDHQAVDPLIGVLSDSNSKVQYAAFSALVKIGSGRAARPIADVLMSAPSSRMWELLKLNIGMRLRNGLLDLIDPGDAQTADLLMDGLERGSLDETQQAIVVRMLGRTADSRLVDPFIALLNDQSETMQSAAADALGWIGDRRAVEPLLRLTGSDTPAALRESAMDALGRLGDDRALEPLLNALNDRDEWVRRAAVVALGMLGGDKAQHALVESLKDTEMVQNAAFEAIKKISRQQHE